MINKHEAIEIAKKQMPSKGYKVDDIILENNVWYVGLSKKRSGFEVEIDAKNGKVISGGGGV